MELGKAEDIAAQLRAQILDGTRLPSARIPSERALAEELGASRMTVRRAIEILEGEGLVIRYVGRGTFVTDARDRILVNRGREVQSPAEAAVAADELRTSGSFLKDMVRLGHTPHVRFLEEPALVTANRETSAQLGIAPGTLVLKRYRLQSADAIPYRTVESYYPADLFAELLTIDIGDQPLFVWLQERHGLQVAHAHEALIARVATSTERQLLRISINAPVVAFDRTVRTASGRSVEWAHIVAVASRYRFTYDYDISDWNQPSHEQEHGNGHRADKGYRSSDAE